MEELVYQYFGNYEDYFVIKEQEQQEPEVKGWNSVPNPTDIKQEQKEDEVK